MAEGDIDPPVDYGDYDYRSPTTNRMPAASSVTGFPLLGHPPLWICERENLLATVTEHDAPFDTVSIVAGMNRPLTQQEVNVLNAKFGISS